MTRKKEGASHSFLRKFEIDSKEPESSLIFYDEKIQSLCMKEIQFENERTSFDFYSKVLSLSGHSTWKFLNWRDHESATALEFKTYFMQECFKEGILVLGTHNVTTKHTKKVVKDIARAYSRIFSKIAIKLKSNQLRAALEVEPLVPLFKIR
jgi:hypothetical protein